MNIRMQFARCLQDARWLYPAGKVSTRSINSCLAPIGGLGGAAVTTVEGLGNSTKGFHPIQVRLTWALIHRTSDTERHFQ